MLKLLLILAIFGLIFYQFHNIFILNMNAAEFVFEWNRQTITLLITTVIFMPINWWLEVFKWLIIMRKHESVTSIQGWKSVITGITLSIVTPNQIGDIIGKTLFLKTFSKVKGAIATLSGGLAQTVVTIIMGSIGGLFILNDQFEFSRLILSVCMLILAILLILLVYFFTNISILQKWISYKKLVDYIKVLTDYTQKELCILLLISGIRLLVFSTQYYLLLLFFGVEISIHHAYMCIGIIFLIQALVPSFILLELGVRGALALFFIGMYTTHSNGILQAAYSLWIINMFLPSLLGLYYLISHKFRF